MAKIFFINTLLSVRTAVDGGGVAVPSRSAPLSR